MELILSQLHPSSFSPKDRQWQQMEHSIIPISRTIEYLHCHRQITSTWRNTSNRTNGQTFDQEGRLLHCEGAEFGHEMGARRITRTNMKTGENEVLTDSYDGLKYNSPNDICVDGNGRIYFTDPCYDDRSIMEMDCDAVYRIDPDGQVSRVLTQPDIQRPNGIAVTQDSKHLYLVDSCPVIGGNRKNLAFRPRCRW